MDGQQGLCFTEVHLFLGLRGKIKVLYKYSRQIKAAERFAYLNSINKWEERRTWAWTKITCRTSGKQKGIKNIMQHLTSESFGHPWTVYHLNLTSSQAQQSLWAIIYSLMLFVSSVVPDNQILCRPVNKAQVLTDSWCTDQVRCRRT